MGILALKTPVITVSEEFAENECLKMPQVYRQPEQPVIRKNHYDCGNLLRKIRDALDSGNGYGFTQNYNQLLYEFQPLIQWALSCWDYLLTVQGCRFILRISEERKYHRSPYRAFQKNDYHRFVHRIFRECVEEHSVEDAVNNFPQYLKDGFWEQIAAKYDALKYPEDTRQRELTPYSYLRCMPYQFLNRFHHDRVYTLIRKLSPVQRRIVNLYFLRFYTDEAAAAKESINTYEVRNRKSKTLRNLFRRDSLVYYLLLQIERY